jgi:hypothetical protein
MVEMIKMWAWFKVPISMALWEMGSVLACYYGEADFTERVWLSPGMLLPYMAKSRFGMINESDRLTVVTQQYSGWADRFYVFQRMHKIGRVLSIGSVQEILDRLIDTA